MIVVAVVAADWAQTHGRGDRERGIGCTAGIHSCARQVRLFVIWQCVVHIDVVRGVLVVGVVFFLQSKSWL